MNGLEAQELLVKLRSAYPSAPITEDTLRLYANTMRSFASELGAKAVESAIAGCKFFPSVAELGHHYSVVREQRAREVRDEERRRENLVYDSMPRRPLKEIPGANDFLGASHAPDLPSEGAGECSDCSKRHELYRLGKFQVCASCANRRLRAKGMAA